MKINIQSKRNTLSTIITNPVVLDKLFILGNKFCITQKRVIHLILLANVEVLIKLKLKCTCFN